MTEAFTNYPLPPWPWMQSYSSPADRLDEKILEKLGMIEQRLSRIEELMASSATKE